MCVCVCVCGVVSGVCSEGVQCVCVVWMCGCAVWCGVPKGMWLQRECSCLSPTHPNLMKSTPARKAQRAHLEILQLLFFSSVARTAPRWVSSFFLQSIPPDSCNRESGCEGVGGGGAGPSILYDRATNFRV